MLAALGAASPAAAAFDECTYDAATRTVAAKLTTQYEATLSVGAGGAILNDDAPCDAATTANTDAVDVTGSYQSDHLTIDESGPGGPFVHPGTSDEIRFDVDFSDETYCPDYRCPGTEQILKVVGTPGDDDIRAGFDGELLVNLDAASDFDADVHSVGGEVEIDGGGGNDTLTGLGGSGAGFGAVTATLRGGSGDDTLGAGGDDDLVYPGSGDDVVYGSSSGRTTVSYADAPSGVTADLGDAVVADDGFGDSDRFALRTITTLRGSDHADHLSVASRYLQRGVHVLAGGGDDVVVGGDWGATLEGGAGDDRLYARGYGGTIKGGPGDDLLRGSDYVDSLYGGPGEDVLQARAGKGHRLDGAVTFKGGDLLDGGPGDDLLDGGPDADHYVFYAPHVREKDTIVEGPGGGHDLVDFHYSIFDAPIAVDVDLSSRRRAFSRSETRVIRTAEPGGARYLENVAVGGETDSHVVGNDADNVIYAGGPEPVDCRGGRDTVVRWAPHLPNCEVLRP